MNLSELKAQVLQNIGREDITDQIPAYINLALERIHNDFPRFPAWERTSYATVDKDQRRISLPDTLSVLLLLQFANSKSGKLTRISRREYDQNYHEIHTDKYKKGVPELYTVWQNHLELYPIPDQELNYYIRWIRQPKRLTEETDEPFIPHDNAIIECATMITYNRIGQPEEGNQHYRIYRSHMTSAIERVSQRHGDTDYKLEPYRAKKHSSPSRDVIRREDFYHG